MSAPRARAVQDEPEDPDGVVGEVQRESGVEFREPPERGVPVDLDVPELFRHRSPGFPLAQDNYFMAVIGKAFADLLQPHLMTVWIDELGYDRFSSCYRHGSQLPPVRIWYRSLSATATPRVVGQSQSAHEPTGPEGSPKAVIRFIQFIQQFDRLATSYT